MNSSGSPTTSRPKFLFLVVKLLLVASTIGIEVLLYEFALGLHTPM